MRPGHAVLEKVFCSMQNGEHNTNRGDCVTAGGPLTLQLHVDPADQRIVEAPILQRQFGGSSVEL
jgi:hypothetical protein